MGYLSLSLLSNNRKKKPKRLEEDTCFGTGAQIQKRDSLTREKWRCWTWNSNFKCYGVAFLYGSAFSIFMLRELFLGAALLGAHWGKLEPVGTSRYVCNYQPFLHFISKISFAWITSNWHEMLLYDKYRGSILTLLSWSLFQPTCGLSADPTGPLTLL